MSALGTLRFGNEKYIMQLLDRRDSLVSRLSAISIARENGKLTAARRPGLYNPEIKGVLYPGARGSRAPCRSRGRKEPGARCWCCGDGAVEREENRTEPSFSFRM